MRFNIKKHDGPARLARLTLNGKSVNTPTLFSLPNSVVFSNTSGKIDVDSEDEILVDNDGIKILIPFKFQMLKKDLREIGANLLSKNADILVSPPYVFSPYHIDKALKKSIDRHVKIAKEWKEVVVGKDVASYVLGGGSETGRKYCAEELCKTGYRFLILTYPTSMLRNPRKLCNFLVSMKKGAVPDSLIYFSGPVYPSYYAHLIYVGIDTFDSSALILSAKKGLMIFQDRIVPVNKIETNTCYCKICSTYGPKEINKLDHEEKFRTILSHNHTIAISKINRIREAIRYGELRELVEKENHNSPSLTAFLRLLDHQHYNFLEQYTPVAKSEPLICIGSESYYAPQIHRFRKRVQERYMPLKDLAVVVILPCSAKKPYSTSKTHKKLRYATKSGAKNKIASIGEVIITSPLGIVPRELEDVYPANAYDIPVTGRWEKEEIDITAECLSSYINKLNKDICVIAHVEGALKEICEIVMEKTRKEILFTDIQGALTSKKSLSSLEKLISNVTIHLTGVLSPKSRKIDFYRKITDYQFGKGSGELLIQMNDQIIRKRQLTLVQDRNGIKIAHLRSYGLFALTIQGGERLHPLGSKYLVKFDGEELKGNSLFAVGVSYADPEIRPYDECRIYDAFSKLIATGRAKMSGNEMVQASSGVAVQL